MLERQRLSKTFLCSHSPSFKLESLHTKLASTFIMQIQVSRKSLLSLFIFRFCRSKCTSHNQRKRDRRITKYLVMSIQ